MLSENQAEIRLHIVPPDFSYRANSLTLKKAQFIVVYVAVLLCKSERETAETKIAEK
jgi:hypothetical protein